jgi:hypothetical protein
MEADGVISLQVTIAEFNQLTVLAEPAFRIVALFNKMRDQAMAQTGAVPPATVGNGPMEQAHVSDR